MIKETSDYTIFKFREDNREKIDKAHVRKLVESIKSRNLLKYKPMDVNPNMEIIDGQHRFLAAQTLNVPIFYQVNEKIESNDIILLNISKNWTVSDYLNFYVKNGFPEYIKLNDFIKKNEISISVALSLIVGQSRENMHVYRQGNFLFKDDLLNAELAICWRTIDLIKKLNGYSVYTRSSRFWKALIIVLKDTNFNEMVWFRNLERMISKVGPRANTKSYVELFMEIHNWKNSHKIHMSESRNSLE